MLTEDKQTQLAELLSLLCDDRFGQRELDCLEQLLLDDPEAQTFYQQYIGLDEELACSIVDASQPTLPELLRWDAKDRDPTDQFPDIYSPLADSEPPASPATPVASPSSPAFPTAVSYSTAECFPRQILLSYGIGGLFTAVFLLIASLITVTHPTSVAPSNNPPTFVRSTPPSDAEFVGRVTGMVDVHWADINTSTEPGNRVFLGRKFKLSSGLMEITYNTGAKVILQGPVTYQVDSLAGGYLSLGKLTARLEKKTTAISNQRLAVSGQGAEKVVSGQWPVASETNPEIPKSLASRPQSPAPIFAVRTPTAVVTDLGTEFGVEVDKNGRTETSVFVGEVMAASLGQSGRPVRSVCLKAGESAIVMPNVVDVPVQRTSTGSIKKFIRTMPGPIVVLFQDDASQPTRLFGWGQGDWPEGTWRLSGVKQFIVVGNAYSAPDPRALARIATNGRCWSLLPGTSAVRNFGFDLPIGAVFTIELNSGNTTTGHSMGFGLCNAMEQPRFEFAIEDEQAAYSIHDEKGSMMHNGIHCQDTKIPNTDRGLRMALVRIDVDTYRLVVERLEDHRKFEFNRRFLKQPDGNDICRLRVWNNAPAETALYFNHIRVIGPKPGNLDTTRKSK